jgi:hypothetical protein
MEEIMIRLVLDISTMRVIYFTDDLNQTLHPADETLIHDFRHELPNEITLSNCWNWKLEGDKLVESISKKQNEYVPTIFELNKKECLNFLIQRVNDLRMKYQTDCEMGIFMRLYKFEQSFMQHSDFITMLAKVNNVFPEDYKKNVIEKEKETMEALKITEINREYFKEKINQCNNSEVLYEIRDHISSCDLLEIQYGK